MRKIFLAVLIVFAAGLAVMPAWGAATIPVDAQADWDALNSAGGFTGDSSNEYIVLLNTDVTGQLTIDGSTSGVVDKLTITGNDNTISNGGILANDPIDLTIVDLTIDSGTTQNAVMFSSSGVGNSRLTTVGTVELYGRDYSLTNSVGAGVSIYSNGNVAIDIGPNTVIMGGNSTGGLGGNGMYISPTGYVTFDAGAGAHIQGGWSSAGNGGIGVNFQADGIVTAGAGAIFKGGDTSSVSPGVNGGDGFYVNNKTLIIDAAAGTIFEGGAASAAGGGGGLGLSVGNSGGMNETNVTLSSGSPEFKGGNTAITGSIAGGSGAAIYSNGKLTIEGSASPIFTGGDADNYKGGNGVRINISSSNSGDLIISDDASPTFKGGAGKDTSGGSGGHGVLAEGAGTVTLIILGDAAPTFTGGEGNDGGSGLLYTANGSLTIVGDDADATFEGGNVSAAGSGIGGYGISFGGDAMTIAGDASATFSGGEGVSYGGDGAFFDGDTLTITTTASVDFTGGDGAGNGGFGLYSPNGTLTIGGEASATFKGGDGAAGNGGIGVDTYGPITIGGEASATFKGGVGDYYGGSGAYIENGPLTIEDQASATFIGGDGDYGGRGADISDAPVTIKGDADATFTGGEGINAEGGFGVYLLGDTLSIIDDATATFTGGVGNNNGGDGAHLIGDALSISGGASAVFTGGEGGSAYVITSAGGHGVYVEGELSVSTSGTAEFNGGDSGYYGGNGASHIDTLNISGGASPVFTGGDGGYIGGEGAYIAGGGSLVVTTTGTAEFNGGSSGSTAYTSGINTSSSNIDFDLSGLQGSCIASGERLAWDISGSNIYTPSASYDYWINTVATRTGGSGGTGGTLSGGDPVPFDYSSTPTSVDWLRYIEITGQSSPPPPPPAPPTVPTLPPGTPKNIEAVLPAAKKNVGDAAKATGMDKGSLEMKNGEAKLKGYLALQAARNASGSSNINKALPLPVFTAGLKKPGNIAAVCFKVTGADLMAKSAFDVGLVKIFPDRESELFKYEWVPKKFGDRQFTILTTDSPNKVIFGTLRPSSEYWLVVFIEDGGSFDLDNLKNGFVTDPAVLFSSKSGGGGSGGGCDGITGAGLLGVLALLAGAVFRRTGRQK